MDLEGTAKHPLTGPSVHLSPCQGKRKGAVPIPLVRQGTGAEPKLRFLSSGQGESWLAKRDDEGVFPAVRRPCKLSLRAMQKLSESDNPLWRGSRGEGARYANLESRAAR